MCSILRWRPESGRLCAAACPTAKPIWRWSSSPSPAWRGRSRWSRSTRSSTARTKPRSWRSSWWQAPSARASCDTSPGGQTLVPPGDPRLVFPPLTSVDRNLLRVGDVSVGEEELLDGVRGLLERVPVDDVPTGHRDDFQPGAEVRDVLGQLLLADDAEVLGVDEQRRRAQHRSRSRGALPRSRRVPSPTTGRGPGGKPLASRASTASSAVA